MRKSFKNSWLSICLLASVAMVGCGGGGGGGGNPAAPVNTTSNEARAAQEAVSPVLQNADTILGQNVASFRYSTSNIQEFSVTSTNNAVMTAFDTPELLRAVLRASGGNIEDGLWMGEKDAYNYFEIASFSNGVYERTLYYVPVLYEEPTNENETPLTTAGHYLINGCNCVLDGTTLKSLSINPNTQITIEEFTREGKTKNLIKGTIDTDLKVAYDSGKEENIPDSDSFIDYSGNKITTSENGYYWGFKATKKITSKITYSLNKPIVLKVNNFFGTRNAYNYIWNWNNGYSDSTTELTKNEYSSKSINITISGITGTISTAKTTYLGNFANYNYGQWNTYEYSDYLTVSEKPVSNFKYASTCEVTVNGDLTNNQSFGKVDYWAYGDETIETTPTQKRSATINNVNVKLRNVSGNLDSIVVGDAEAYVDIGDYKQDQAIKIGNREVVFNKAKVTVTGLKYDYRWKPKSEKQIYQPNAYMWQDNEEYKKETETMHRNCFGNAIVHLDAEETKNSVTIKADCEINKKTATLNLVNNGNLIVEDNNNGNILAFNFKTVDINATNADVLANNKCEGAKLIVKGVEKDGTKSERTYNVVNGKLVLDTKSQKDKQAPTNLPKVDIAPLPDGLEDNSKSIGTAVSDAKADLEKPEAKKTTKTNDPNETLKVVDKNGKKVGHYEKKAAGNSKKIDSNITAKDKIICTVSVYGDNEYTIIFIIDYTNSASPQIKGSIFQGKKDNITMDSVENRIAQFAGKNGKITVITSEGSSEVAVQ